MMKKPELPLEHPHEQDVSTNDPLDEISRLRRQLHEKELELKKSNMRRDAY